MTRVAVLLAVLAVPARAQVCAAGASGQAFGTYNPFSPVPTMSSATLTISCQATVSALVSYTIALTAGGSGSVAARSLTNGGARLPYQLYRDAGRAQVWGDGTAGSFGVNDGYLLSVVAPVVRAYTAYGAIPPGSQVLPGAYSDTVTILLTY